MSLYRSILLALLSWATLAPSAILATPQEVEPGQGFIGRGMEVLSTADTVPLDVVARSTDFVRCAQDVPNLGLGASTHWARFRTAPHVEPWVLHIAQADLDHVEVFLIPDGGEAERIGHTGLDVPGSKRVQYGTEYAFRLAPTDQAGTVYIMARSSKQLQFPLTLETEAEYTAGKLIKHLYWGGYMGVMLVMVLYNFFIFLSMRSRSYLLYVAYIVSVALTQCAFIGPGPFYLWTELTWFSTRATTLLTISTAILASEFMIQFVDTRTNCVKLHRGIRWFYPLFAACMILVCSGQTLLAYQVTQLMAGLFASYLLFVVIRVWQGGSRQAAYFLVAWSGFLMGTTVFVMKDLELLPYNLVTVYAMPIGSAIEGVLLSFALADRINVLRREKEQSQALALAAAREHERIIREQNTLLELKVKERTRDLEQSNEHLKRTQTQLVSAEKMASLGQLTAGIAHEINNPINFITSNIRPLKRNIADLLTVVDLYRKVEPANASQGLQAVRAEAEEMGLDETITELDEIIDCIAEGSSRTAEIVRGLRNFSRLDEDALKDADLNEGLRSTLALMVPQYRDRVEFDVQLDELPRVECYPGRLNQVFMNILSNGVQAAMAKEGDAMPTIQVRTRTLGDHVEVVIADNGIGMTDEVKARIFDPFYTTKDVGEGTGLGLAIAYGIIEDHHATIAVDSTPGQGTAFRITIPVRHQRTLEKRA